MSRRASAFLALLLFGIAALGVAAPLWADDDPDPPEPAAESESEAEPEKAKDTRQDRVEDVLMGKPLTRWTLLLGKYVPLVIGLVLLVLLYVRADKIRAGLVPAPDPVEPTAVTGVGTALLLFIFALAIGPLIAIAFLSGGQDDFKPTLPEKIASLAIVTIPVAFVVMFRRARLADPRPPGFLRAIKIGLWTFCVASAIVIPVGLLVGMLMSMFGKEPQVQDLVLDVIEPQVSWYPYLIAVYGAILAPIVEESIFRGLLYPAIKRAAGGGTRGAVIGIFIVSALFAAIHQSWTALAPLFALAVILNIVFEKTNSLTACIIAHAVHNGMTLLPLVLVGELS